MEEEPTHIKVQIEDEIIEVPVIILEISTYLKSISEYSQPGEVFVIDYADCTPSLFKQIISYLEQQNWNPPAIAKPIQSGNLEQNLSPTQYQFIKDYPVFNEDDDRLKKLIECAIYLGIQSVVNLGVCCIATEFYIKPNQSGFKQLMDQRGLTEDMTIEDDFRIQKEYAQIVGNYDNEQFEIK